MVEPSGSINGIGEIQLGQGGELPSASAGLGLGGTKKDWKKQVGDMEELLSTGSSGSATFGCSVTCGCCVFLGSACLHWDLAGRTNTLPPSLESGCLCWH